MDPRPKAPVVMALKLFFSEFDSYFCFSDARIWLRAGTQLLLTRAPPIPPTKMPRQIIMTESAKIKGNGPERIMEMKKNTVPMATRTGKSFFSLGTKFMIKEVIVYVIVSIEKIIPTIQIGNSSYFILNCSSGSLNVRHIREVDMQSAQERTLNLPRSPKNVNLMPSSSC